MALAALQALGVPRPFQHFKDEAVQDQLVAPPHLGIVAIRNPENIQLIAIDLTKLHFCMAFRVTDYGFSLPISIKEIFPLSLCLAKYFSLCTESNQDNI